MIKSFITSGPVLCANKDSDHPGHTPSLIRDFTVCMELNKSLSSPSAHNRDFDKAWKLLGLI